ncbi:Uncharacterized protein GBIM_16546 [Gryllus bimaculatus]|nr:Uncharacterized protein GBIM_16546 [Gryllus bimaculatus]
MKELEEAVVAHGKERDFKKLGSVLDNTDLKVLKKLFSSKLGHIDAFQIINYTLMGLPKTGSAQVKRPKLILHVLETMLEKNMSTSEANKIIDCLSCEMIWLSPSQMVRLTQWCVDSIQQSEQKYMAWKVLLPNLLNLLSDLSKVELSGTEMSGCEYRRQIINTLCNTTWNPNIITSVAGMFTDMQLAPDEHLQVVFKLCQGIEKLEPASLPPLVHQLLLLTKQQHGLPLFLHLQQYFTRGLYNRIRCGAQESNSGDFISEDVLGSRHELMRAESTILFYINQAANVGNANIKDLLNSLKSTVTAPEFCLNPFFFTVFLSISFVTCYEDPVFDVIRSAVARVLVEDKRKEHSAWLQNIIPSGCDLERLITQIIESSGREREMIREGFVKLAFALLKGDSRQKLGHGRQVWKYGRLILCRLVKKYYDVAPTVVQLICNHIIIGPHVTQYVDTLLKLSVGTPLMLAECQENLKQLIEQLLQSASVSQQVVVCVMPLVPVKGFLLMLKTLDVKSLAIATQSTQCSQSTSSQVHSEPLEWGDSFGKEVINVLQRCTTQQAEVRSALYTGLFEAVSKSPHIYPHAVDFVLSLLQKYYKSDEIVQPPLDFNKTLSVKEMDVTLMEPIGQLVFLCQQFVTRVGCNEELEDDKSVNQVREILDLLCKRMIMCTPENLGLVDDVDLNDILPESRCLNEVYHQALVVYEALIAYTFASWSISKKDHHQELISLFRSYTKLLDFGKNAAKPGKNGEKSSRAKRNKSMNDTISEQKAGMKKKAIGLKKSASVLDLKSVVLMLEALFSESVPWAQEDDLRPVKNRREFCRYALQVTLQLLQQVHSMKYTDLQVDSGLFNYCSQIGSIIYKRFLHMEDDVDSPLEEDPLMTVLAVECYNELLASVILHFEPQLPQLLEDMGGVKYSEGLGKQLHVPIKSVQKRLVVSLEEAEETDNDPVLKKLPLLFASLLSQLSLHLPLHNSTASQVFSWLKNLVTEKTMTNKPVVKEIFSLLFKLQIRHKVDGALFDNVALQLLNLMDAIDTDTPVERVSRFAILTEVTQIVCLQQLCAAIMHMLNDIDWLVARSRGMFAARAYPSSQSSEEKTEHLCKQEREICSHMSHCVKLVTLLVRISLPEGPAMDSVLKLLINLYNSVSNLAKYFSMRSSKVDMAFQTARFTHVVHLTAVELAKHVQWLLLHVMDDPDEDEEERKKSKKGEKLRMARELKDSKLVPRIVYGMEMFEKNVILLSKKCNVNLMERVKVHSGRDFRIKIDVVKTTLENQEGNNEEEADIEEDSDEVQRSELEADKGEAEEEEEKEDDEEEEEEEDLPARKKKRFS